MVQSYDAAGKESVESEKNRFTIIPKGKETEAIDLELDPFIQHGHVIEVTGKTADRGAGDGERQRSSDDRQRMASSITSRRRCRREKP